MGLLQKIKGWFASGGPVEQKAEEIKAKTENVAGEIGEFADKAATVVGNTAEKVWDKVDDYVDPVIDKAEQRAEDIYDAVLNVFDEEAEIQEVKPAGEAEKSGESGPDKPA